MQKMIPPAYALDGSLVAACSGQAPCPCWLGDDPDGGTCHAIYAYHIEYGRIAHVEVSGLTYVQVVQIPGHALAGHWRQVISIDDAATPAQRQALLDAWCGRLGGPLAVLAGLTDEPLGIQVVPISFAVERGTGILRAGTILDVELSPYVGAGGRATTLHDAVFSTIPGAPLYLARAVRHHVHMPDHGMTWESSGRHALQGDFHFEAPARAPPITARTEWRT
jgi:hypothetical protein